MNKYTPTKNQRDLEASINWEYVHHHHPVEAGPVTSGPWLERIIAHARKNGFSRQISDEKALAVINANLW